MQEKTVSDDGCRKGSTQVESPIEVLGAPDQNVCGDPEAPDKSMRVLGHSI
jgi:hypothetical protein